MKIMKKSLLALTVLAVTTLQAQAADLKVTGTISPSACTPTFDNGATVDYGNIGISTLSEDDYTVLPAKTINFSINCSAATKVGFKLTNGRVGSLVGDTEGTAGFGYTPASVRLFGLGYQITAAGLGMNGAEKIGGYASKMDQGDATADGNTVDNIATTTSGVWGRSNTLMMFPTVNPTFTAASKGTLIPLAFKTYNAKLQVQAYINKASELTLTRDVKLDGLVTFDLEYLP